MKLHKVVMYFSVKISAKLKGKKQIYLTSSELEGILTCLCNFIQENYYYKRSWGKTNLKSFSNSSSLRSYVISYL